MMNKPLIHYIKKLPRYTMLRLWQWLAPILPDKIYLKVLYRLRMGYWMDFSHPKTFNEKIQWLKLYNRRPEYTTMVDKYAVKKYVADIIGEEHIIPTIGVWDKPEQIDWDALPQQFVLKTTHGGGGCGVVICKDKTIFNKEEAKQKLQKSLDTDIYYVLREWPYKNVKKRIIAEPYMTDGENDLQQELRDYKFFCFDGKIKMFKIDYNRFVEHHANYYDKNGELLPFGEAAFSPQVGNMIQMPEKLKEMMTFAERLSEGHPFMRVDFYQSNKRVYFGEITFFPASGMGIFNPTEWDEKIGNWLAIQ